MASAEVTTESLLRRAVTVLDEPYHRAAVGQLMGQAADELADLRARLAQIEAERDALKLQAADRLVLRGLLDQHCACESRDGVWSECAWHAEKTHIVSLAQEWKRAKERRQVFKSDGTMAYQVCRVEESAALDALFAALPAPSTDGLEGPLPHR